MGGIPRYLLRSLTSETNCERAVAVAEQLEGEDLRLFNLALREAASTRLDRVDEVLAIVEVLKGEERTSALMLLGEFSGSWYNQIVQTLADARRHPHCSLGKIVDLICRGNSLDQIRAINLQVA